MVRFVAASVLALSLGSWAAAATPVDGTGEAGNAAASDAAPEGDAAPTVIVGDIAAQPDVPLSAAATATAPIGSNIARPQPLVAAPAAPERIGIPSAGGRPATAEAPSAAPVVAQTPRVQGGAKAEEPAPVARVAVPAAPVAIAAAPARAPVPPPGAQVVLVQQQPSLPGATPQLQLAPGSNRIQVAPGQPIPPLLGGGPATPVAPALTGPIPADPRPALTAVPVMLEAGAGRLIQLPAPAAAVFAADPRVARVQPASPTSLFVMAVAAGRTNVIATGDDGQPIVEYDVTVAGRQAAAAAAPTPAPSFAAGPTPTGGLPRPSQVESMIRRSIRGGEGVRVAALAQRGYILNGMLPNAADAQRAEAIAKAMGGEGIEVINNISLLSSIQVNLRVRVAEISRQVTRELGFNWAAIGGSGDWLFGMAFGGGGLLSRILPGVPASSGDTTGRYGGRFTSGSTDINGIIDALAQDNLVSVLAEPNLTAQSGEVASFLAGGEFPVPIASAAAGGAATISVEFKQYGVGLAFVPTVLSPERLNLRVRPEVSELSDTGSVTVPLATGVVRIPGVIVRRAETTIELGSGQSFAIAGLLTRTHRMNSSSLIGLGDIPVLGALFRSDRFRRDESELVIIATPYLVRPVSNPRALATPTEGFRPATDLERVMQRRQLRGPTGVPSSQGRRPPVDAGFIVE